MLINSVTTSTSANAIDVMDGNSFAQALEANVNVSYLRRSKSRRAAEVARGPAFGNIHSEKGKQVDAATLASRWGIGHKKALNTVRRRFPTNDRMMRHRRLPHNVFTDTMFSGVKSKMRNTCA